MDGPNESENLLTERNVSAHIEESKSTTNDEPKLSNTKSKISQTTKSKTVIREEC